MFFPPLFYIFWESVHKYFTFSRADHEGTAKHRKDDTARRFNAKFPLFLNDEAVERGLSNDQSACRLIETTT